VWRIVFILLVLLPISYAVCSAAAKRFRDTLVLSWLCGSFGNVFLIVKTLPEIQQGLKSGFLPSGGISAIRGIVPSVFSV